MFNSPFDTSFPSSSIFGGGVSFGAVESMLFGGFSSVGHKSLDTHMFELDSYMDGLDYSLFSSGNNWSSGGSNYSRFLDSSPLSLAGNFDPWGLGWGLGWGSDWSMNYGLLALSQPYYNSFADIFQSPQFKFSTSDYDLPNYDFSTTQTPQTRTSSTPSVRGESSGRTERAAKEPLKLELPGEGDIPSKAKAFIDEMNRVSDPSKPDKPRVGWRFEDINGKRYAVLKLEYEGLTQEKVRRARLDPLVNKIKELVQGDSTVAVELGNRMISNDENLKLSGVGMYSAESFDANVFKSGLSDILAIEEVAGESENALEIGGYKFERAGKFTVRTEGSHYFIDASQEEGERRIRELTGDGNKEEAWIYVEYNDAKGFHKRWFECGEKEMKDSVKLASTFLNRMTSDNSYSVTRKSFRHQHPDGPGYDPPSDQDLGSAIDLLTDEAFKEGSDVSVITAEGVYTLTIPSGTTAEALRAKIPGYKSALEKRDGRTTFGKEIHDVGFDCRFRYWGPDDTAAAPAPAPAPVLPAEPAEAPAVPPPAAASAPALAPAPAPVPAHAAPVAASASLNLPRWLVEGTGEKFDRPYIKDNGVKKLGDVGYREINFLYKRGVDVARLSDSQFNPFIKKVTDMLREKPDLVVVIGPHKFSSDPRLIGRDGITDISYLNAGIFKTAVSGSREFAPATVAPTPAPLPAPVKAEGPKKRVIEPSLPVPEFAPGQTVLPAPVSVPRSVPIVTHPVPQLIRQFVARFGGDGTDPARPKIDVKWDDNDGEYILAASYDSALDKGKITSSAVANFLDEAKRRFKDRGDIIIVVGEKKFYFDKVGSIKTLTPEKFAKLAGGTLPKLEPAPVPVAQPTPQPIVPPAPLSPPPAVEPPLVVVAPPIVEPPALTPEPAPEPVPVAPPAAPTIAQPPAEGKDVIQPGVLGASLWGEDLIIEAGGMRFLKKDEFKVRTAGEHYFVEASLKKGERAIGRLAATSGVEGSWIYVEGVDKEGRKIQVWFECGIEPGIRETTTQYDFLPELKGRFKSYSQIADRHLHHEEQDEDVPKLDFHPPSGTDLGAAIERAAKFKGDPFDSGVITLYGVYTIKASDSSSQAEVEKSLAAMGNTRNQFTPSAFCDQLEGIDCSFRYFNDDVGHVLGLQAEWNQLKKDSPLADQKLKELNEEKEKLTPEVKKRYKISDDTSQVPLPPPAQAAQAKVNTSPPVLVAPGMDLSDTSGHPPLLIGGKEFQWRAGFERASDGQPYYVEMDEEDGIRELAKFTTPQDKEMALVYLELVDETTGAVKKTWCNYGKKATGGEVKANADFIGKSLKDPNVVIKAASFYHTHPEADYQDSYAANSPSQDDIKRLFEHNTLLKKNSYSGVFREGIITQHGVFNFKVAEGVSVGRERQCVREVEGKRSEHDKYSRTTSASGQEYRQWAEALKCEGVLTAEFQYFVPEMQKVFEKYYAYLDSLDAVNEEYKKIEKKTAEMRSSGNPILAIAAQKFEEKKLRQLQDMRSVALGELEGALAQACQKVEGRGESYDILTYLQTKVKEDRGKMKESA